MTTIQTPTGTWSVSYNAYNRPVTWTKSTGEKIYMMYDAQGRRVEKRVLNASGVRTLRERYVYVGYACVQVLNGDKNNAVVKEFAWDPTEPVATRPLMFKYVPNGVTMFYAFDGNKNVSDVFCWAVQNGVPAHYDYAPFGTITRTAKNTPFTLDFVSLNPWRFSSEFCDSELDLVYYNYRHYSPSLGRFLSRDPIEEQGGLNLYAFCGSSPTLSSDRQGLSIFDLSAHSQSSESRTSVFDFVSSFINAMDELLKAYNDMREANTIGADKYFHCIGMCNARRNSNRELVIFIAKLREVTDLLRKGIENGLRVPIKNAEDSLEDMAANMQGIDCSPDKSCEECCCKYKVNGL